eukprot:353887-Chlamydomonas_euryale.AAC.4
MGIDHIMPWLSMSHMLRIWMHPSSHPPPHPQNLDPPFLSTSTTAPLPQSFCMHVHASTPDQPHVNPKPVNTHCAVGSSSASALPGSSSTAAAALAATAAPSPLPCCRAPAAATTAWRRHAWLRRAVGAKACVCACVCAAVCVRLRQRVFVRQRACVRQHVL